MEDKVGISSETAEGKAQRGTEKVGDRTVISVDRLQATGRDVILTESKPRILNLRTREVVMLRQDKDIFILDMWIWVERETMYLRRERGFSTFRSGSWRRIL